MDTETGSLALYGLIRKTERLEATGLLAYGQSDCATQRAIVISDPNAPTGISRTASGSTEGDAYQASITGYWELLEPGAASFGHPVGELI